MLAYHLAYALAPVHLKRAADTGEAIDEGPSLVLNEPGMYVEDPDDGRRHR